MSMILDALRKSEAERRSAQAPDLFAEPALAGASRSVNHPHWLWAALAIIAIIALAWIARSLWTAPPRPLPPAANAVDTTVRVVVPSMHAEPVDPALSTPAATDVANAAAPIANATIVKVPTVAAPIVDAPIAARLDRVLPPAVVATAIPPPAKRAQAPQATPDSLPPPLPRPATAAMRMATSTMHAPVIAVPPPPTERAPVASPRASATTAERSRAASTTPLRLADLTVEERQQLPALKMSMHLWNPDATQRFVILDGSRVGEGDRVGDAVVEEITTDGMLMAWHGQQLKLSMH